MGLVEQLQGKSNTLVYGKSAFNINDILGSKKLSVWGESFGGENGFVPKFQNKILWVQDFSIK